MAPHRFGFVLPAAAVLVGCATSATYIPEQRATATLAGRTAATYPLPSAQAQQGDLRVAAFGVTELEHDGAEVPAVHVRLAVANSGAERISLDTSEQRLQLPDGRPLAPAALRGRSPLVVVEPGTARDVDLYFPLPPDLREDDPPRFDLVWRVRVGDRLLSHITPFDEVGVDPALARQQAAEDTDYYWNGGPYWHPAPWWW